MEIEERPHVCSRTRVKGASVVPRIMILQAGRSIKEPKSRTIENEDEGEWSGNPHEGPAGSTDVNPTSSVSDKSRHASPASPEPRVNPEGTSNQTSVLTPVGRGQEALDDLAASSNINPRKA